jgi:hypothetical protein
VGDQFAQCGGAGFEQMRFFACFIICFVLCFFVCIIMRRFIDERRDPMLSRGGTSSNQNLRSVA